MNWKEKIDLSLRELSGASVYSRIRRFSPVLADSGFYKHILDPNQDNYLLFASILRYLGSHKDPAGFGLGLGCMAMANLCGQILKATNRIDDLNRLIRGNGIFSLAVSEKGWKGRLHNVRTSLQLDSSSQEGKLLLTGEKNFATNGRQADVYIVIARVPRVIQDFTSESHEKDSESFQPVFLPGNTAGLEVRAFDFPVCKEATHAELGFHNISVSRDQVLDLNYKEWGKFLPNWERFSFHFLFLGLLDSILESRLVSGLIDSENFQSDLINFTERLYKRLEMVPTSGIESMKLKDGILCSELIAEYFTSSEWDRLYPPFTLIRKLFPQG